MDAAADSPDLTEPDIGEQTKALFDSVNVALPSSLLQEKDPSQDAWAEQMRELGEKTSWAQLSQGIERTKESAAQSLEDFHRVFPQSPASFAEVASKTKTG